jgi:AcrR family transcriptional regulator
LASKGQRAAEVAAPNTAPVSEWVKLLDEVIARATRDTERKQDRSRRTEKQILNAALRVFGRDGISRARIADIAAEAGISTSTLYEYYASKEDLAYEIPMAHLSEFFVAYRDAALPTLSARERLLLYLQMSADYAREHSEWARLLYLEIWPSVFVGETGLQTNIDDFTKIIRFLIKEGVAEGWISAQRNVYETAALLVGGSNQIIITWLLYRKPRNLTKAGVEMAERMLQLLELEARSG